MKLMTVLLLATLSSFATAQSATTVTTKSPEATADHRNIFSTGLRLWDLGLGVTFGYQRVITPRFALGTSLAFSDKTENSNDSYVNGNYYHDEYQQKSQTLDVLATYYFRDNGNAKWGPLMRGGIGHGWNSADESSTKERKWGNTYARLGGYYQFVWGYRPNSSLGQILEIGTSIYASDQSKTISYAYRNGIETKEEITNWSASLDVAYSLAF